MNTIEKVWGQEKIYVNTELYCCKALYVNAGYMCSTHRHIKKDETFHVVDPVFIWTWRTGWRLYNEGEAVRIYPGTYHRFAAPFDDATIMEVSTHDDPEDSFRLYACPSQKIDDEDITIFQDLLDKS